MRFGESYFVRLCLPIVGLMFPLLSWFCRSRGWPFSRALATSGLRAHSFAAGSCALLARLSSPRAAPEHTTVSEAGAQAALRSRPLTAGLLAHSPDIAALLLRCRRSICRGPTMHTNRAAPPQPQQQKKQQQPSSASSSKSSLSSLQAGLHAYRARAKEQWKAHAFYAALAPSRSGGDGSAGGVAGQWRPDQGGGRCCSTMRRWMARRAVWLRVHLAALGGSREQELGGNSNKTRERTAWSVAVLALIALLLIWWIRLR